MTRFPISLHRAAWLSAVLALPLAADLRAAEFVVTSTADAGAGSLRAAAAAAQAQPGPHTIRFDLPAGSTITLTSGEIDFGGPDVVVQGPGRERLSISGGGNSRIFDISAGRITIADLTLRDGLAFGTEFFAQRGGAVRVAAPQPAAPAAWAKHRDRRGRAVGEPTPAAVPGKDGTSLGLTVVDVAFVNNRAGSPPGSGGETPIGLNGGGGGGAIYALRADLAVRRSEFSGNGTGRIGGAILANGAGIATTRIEDSRFIGNRIDLTEPEGNAAALLVQQSDTVVERSVFRDNVAANGAGGLGRFVEGVAVAFVVDGDYVVRDSEFSGNRGELETTGGGLFATSEEGLGVVPVRIENSTFSGNRATYGGAMAGAVAFTLVHATVAANTALDPQSGAIEVACTGSALTGIASIVHGTVGAPDLALFTQCGRPRVSGLQAFLVGDPGNVGVLGGMLAGIDPRLQPLADNGGGLRTHAPASGSPAIDGATAASALRFDQRGPGFARVAGGAADIGAHEVGPQAAANAHQHGISGTWYEAQTAGQGFTLEVFPGAFGAGSGLAVGGWFTYAAGAPGDAATQRWMTLSGPVAEGASRVAFDVLRNIDGRFVQGPSTQARDVGNATLVLTGCNSAEFSYALTDGSGLAGAIALTRITPDVTCGAAATPNADDFRISGSFFDPSAGGQGLFVEVNPLIPFIAGGWYTYAREGAAGGSPRQRWFSLNGSYVPGTRRFADLQILQSTGGVFDTPPATPVATVPVGRATLEILGCGGARLQYAFTAGENAGSSGTLELQRAGPAPPGCRG
jgi:hypothetical protein